MSLEQQILPLESVELETGLSQGAGRGKGRLWGRRLRRKGGGASGGREWLPEGAESERGGLCL